MVQEVVAVRPELKLLAFCDLEALKQAEIGVKESWSVDRRQNRAASLPYVAGETEAARVDVLLRAEILARIAGHGRHQRDIRSSVQRRRTDVVRGSRNIQPVQVHTEILPPLTG